jgi:hypothetical protein
MPAKLLVALLISAPLMVPGVALADPPADRCGVDDDIVPIDVTSPGHFNKLEKAEHGPPGRNNEGLTARAAAHERNLDRKELCPPPGQAKK